MTYTRNPFYDTTNPEVDALAQRMARVIDFRHTSPATALAACANVIAFVMSLTCAGCRRNIAAQLRQHTDQMVIDADALASADEPTEHQVH